MCGREAHGLSVCAQEHLLPEAHPESRRHSQTPDLEPGQRLQVLTELKFSCCLWLRRGPVCERFWVCDGVSGSECRDEQLCLLEGREV